jgi:alpha/beta superfamily hydrolase
MAPSIQYLAVEYRYTFHTQTSGPVIAMNCRDQWIAGRSGPRLEARIFTPKSKESEYPVIILATGFGSVKENRTASFVKPFVSAGYACITFDYATWGGSEGEPRHLVDPADQYRDVRNVVAWAKEQREFDRSKIIIWGSSFGGLHVTRLLAEDHEIFAGIAQCPCVDSALAASMKPLTQRLRLGFWALCDMFGSFLGVDPIYVRAAKMDNDDIGGPAFMEAEDVARGYAFVVNTSKGPLRNKVAARSVLTMLAYRPAQLADRIVAPYLMVLPEYDSVAPLAAAKDVAKRVKSIESVTVPGGHFDVYEGMIGWEKNIEAQLEFLNRVSPVHSVNGKL